MVLWKILLTEDLEMLEVEIGLFIYLTKFVLNLSDLRSWH